MDPCLSELLETMGRKSDSPVGSETESWSAHRIAEQLNDLSLVPDLVEYLSEEKNIYRRFAAEVLGYLAKNTQDEGLVKQLLEVLPKLDSDDDTLYNALMAIWESGVRLRQGAEFLLDYTTDDRELIRNAAIRALGHFVGEQDEAEDALLNVVENHYDDYDLRYALETLMKIGSSKSVTVLEKQKGEVDSNELKELFNQVITKLE